MMFVSLNVKKAICIFSLFSFLLVVVSSCDYSSKKVIVFPVEMMNKEGKCSTTSSHIDTIDIGYEFTFAQKFYVYNDTILIVRNREKTTSYFVEVYDLSARKMVAQLYPRGNGHGELLSCLLALNGNMLIVNDFMKSQYALVNIDSLLQNPSYSVLPQRHSHSSAPTITPFGEKYLIENEYCFSCSKEEIYKGMESIEQGIENGVSRFIVLDSLSNEFETNEETSDDNKYKYWTRNVACDGQVVVNPTSSKVLYASFGKPEIEVYDADLSIIKLLKGPFELEGHYAVEQYEGDRLSQVMCYQNIPYAYLGYAFNQGDIVSFLFIGDYLVNDASIEHFKSYIVEVDWDGNFKRYVSVDKYMNSLSKSNIDENVFYGTMNDDNGLPRLVKITANED